MVLRIMTIKIMALLVFLVFAVLAFAAPPTLTGFEEFYGRVSGLSAGGQFTLRADIGTNRYETPIVNGQYGYSPTFKIYGQNGQQILFSLVQSGQAVRIGEAVQYQQDAVTPLNFQYTAASALPGPMPSASFNFILGSIADRTMVNGSQVNITFTTTRTSGTAAPVSFGIEGLPSTSLTASFNQSSCTPDCTITLSLTSLPSLSAGSYPLNITATSSGITNKAGFVLTVVNQAVPFNFAINPISDKSMQNGSQINITVTTTRIAGSSTPISFSIVGVPSGNLTAVFTPTSCSPDCVAILSISALATAPAASYQLNITASGGGATNKVSFPLTIVTNQFDFSLSSDRTVWTIARTPASNEIVTTLISGIGSELHFNATGLPEGSSATFSPQSCTPSLPSSSCLSTITISTSSSTILGNYEILVTAFAGRIIHTTTFGLTVRAANATQNQTNRTIATLPCYYDWQCSVWSSCQNSLQSRTCTRADACDAQLSRREVSQVITLPRPAEQQSCQALLNQPAPRQCTPTTKQCVGKTLQECSVDGLMWNTVQECPQLCNPTTRSCADLPAPPRQEEPSAFPTWILYLGGSLVLVAVIILILVGILNQRKLAPGKKYVQESRAGGYEDEQIRNSLEQEGWDDKEINKLLK